jgi:muconate cycloisomerase
MKARIERVEVFGVEVPLNGTFMSAGIAKQAMKCCVVRLTAADGTVGVSSIEPPVQAKPPGTASELLAALRDRVAPALVGEDPTNVHRISDKLDALVPSQHGAAAAMEMACIDLASRLYGVSMATYLGGARVTTLRFNGWIGMLPPEEAAAEAKRWLAAGFKSTKVKVGGGVQADAERVAAVRAAVGSAMDIRIDANALYDADTSLELAKLVKRYDLQLFEQPTAKEDIEGMARVRRQAGIPIMADESISDHASLLEVIKAGAADFVKFGIEQAGGVLRAARMLATAEAAGIPCVIGHGFGLDPSTMAEIMFSATSRNVVPGLECVGPLKMTDTVATSRLDISAGQFTLPDVAGIGLTLDEAKLEQYRVRK